MRIICAVFGRKSFFQEEESQLSRGETQQEAEDFRVGSGDGRESRKGQKEEEKEGLSKHAPEPNPLGKYAGTSFFFF